MNGSGLIEKERFSLDQPRCYVDIFIWAVMNRPVANLGVVAPRFIRHARLMPPTGSVLWQRAQPRNSSYGDREVERVKAEPRAYSTVFTFKIKQLGRTLLFVRVCTRGLALSKGRGDKFVQRDWRHGADDEVVAVVLEGSWIALGGL